jgi:signal transduction histidine kinase
MMKLSRLILIFSLTSVLILTGYFSYTTYQYTESLNQELVTKHHARLSYDINVMKDELMAYMLLEAWDALDQRLGDVSRVQDGTFSFERGAHDVPAETSHRNHVDNYYWEHANGVLTVHERIEDIEGHLLGYVTGRVPVDNVDPLHLRRLFLQFAIGYIVLLCMIFLVLEFVVTRYFVAPVAHLLTRLNPEDIQNIGTNTAKDGRRFVIKELSVIADTFTGLMSTLVSSIAEKERAHSRNHIAQHVAHDIRSPLTALKVVSEQLSEVPEEKRLILRNAVQRIEDIAYDLADGASRGAMSTAQDHGTECASVQLLSSIIEPLLSEKRAQYRTRRDVHICSALTQSSYGICAAIQPVECKRVLSNLVNNAVEACPQGGTITVSLTQTSQTVTIHVSDTGVGIAADILPKVSERGATFGKRSGAGLGLYHARTRIEAWHGTLQVASTIGDGTTVSMTIPQAEPPSWLPKAICVHPEGTIVVLDDDTSIHDVWNERFSTLNIADDHITVLHFSSSADLNQWYSNQEHVLFLCDYELLQETATGLDLIEHLHLTDRAILVTSGAEDMALRSRCATLGVQILPKSLAGFVPIVCQRPVTNLTPLPRSRSGLTPNLDT